MTMNTNADVIVVGAGPAGSMAAKAVAEKGYAVTVYEKGPLTREKPCAGAVSGRVLTEFGLNREDAFWERRCSGVFLCSPENQTVALPGEGPLVYLVMRATFDSYLVEKAREEGATFVDHAYAEPFVKDGKVRGVRVSGEVIEADVVIACDGTPSSFAQALQVYQGDDNNQAATYQYQMRMDERVIDERVGDVIEIYFGHRWVPYGYAWIFPKKDVVTVGVGTWLHALRERRVNVKACLDTFIAEHPVASAKLEGAEILYRQSAMIGFSGIVHPLYLDNCMVAGDAAGFVSLPTGEGIYYSMVSGKTAGEVAAEALERGDCSRAGLKEYEKRSMRKVGADLKWGPWLRKVALDREKDQERLVRLCLRDRWFGDMVRDVIVGNIRYDRFLVHFLSRPHKVWAFYRGYVREAPSGLPL